MCFSLELAMLSSCEGMSFKNFQYCNVATTMTVKAYVTTCVTGSSNSDRRTDQCIFLRFEYLQVVSSGLTEARGPLQLKIYYLYDWVRVAGHSFQSLNYGQVLTWTNFHQPTGSFSHLPT